MKENIELKGDDIILMEFVVKISEKNPVVQSKREKIRIHFYFFLHSHVMYLGATVTNVFRFRDVKVARF